MDKENYSKSKVSLHLWKGLSMETVSSPFIRLSVGLSMLMLSAAVSVYIVAAAFK